MAQYLVNDSTIERSNPVFLDELGKSYQDKNRPLCLCKRPGVLMYIARSGDSFVLKRMPCSGHQHHPNCESFEIPAELSGRGALDNKAIKEDQETGMTNLKLDFSLSKSSANRAMPAGDGKESTTIKADPAKLSIRSVLHFLYEEAGLNKWSPKMGGKRNWFIVRKYLQSAAQNVTTRRSPLAESLLIPEKFTVEDKDSISSRRRQFFNKLKKTGSKQAMGLLIGEVKAIEPTRFDYKMIIKHMPSTPVYMGEDVFKRIHKQFSLEMAFFEQDENVHLLAISTFLLSASGCPQIDTISFMLLDRNWLPFENIEELELNERLVTEERHFIKGLRYNLGGSDVIASAVITDTDEPTAVYLIPVGAEESHYNALETVIDESEFQSCVWDLNEETAMAVPNKKIS